jgi:FtsH-binding integral membrane protein
MEAAIWNDLGRLIPLLIPVILIQLGLMIFALVDILKKKAARGNFVVWIIVIVVVNIFGPIAYFAFGRVDE